MELTRDQENLISDLAVEEKILERYDADDLAAYLCERSKEERAMLMAEIKGPVENEEENWKAYCRTHNIN